MKRIRVSSIALRWILAVTLTASPLLAQYTPQREAVIDDATVQTHRPAVRVVDENNNPLVGTTIFSSLRLRVMLAGRGMTFLWLNGNKLACAWHQLFVPKSWRPLPRRPSFVSSADCLRRTGRSQKVPCRNCSVQFWFDECWIGASSPSRRHARNRGSCGR